MRKGDPVLSRIWSLGKVVSSPSRAQGKAPTENKFGYFTAVKYCTGGNYIDDSYHKQIVRQHSCRRIIWPGQVAWSTVV